MLSDLLLFCYWKFCLYLEVRVDLFEIFEFLAFHGMTLDWNSQPHHLIRNSENQVIKGTGPLLLVGMYVTKPSYSVIQARLT